VVIQKSTEWKTNGYSAYLTEQAVGVNGLLATKQYQVVSFAFTIERIPTFFKYVLIAPSVLLVILTLCLFCIPVQSGERFMLGQPISTYHHYHHHHHQRHIYLPKVHWRRQLWGTGVPPHLISSHLYFV